MRHGTFGDTLRQAREAAGRTYADVAAATKIRAEYLRALEEGEYHVLPERPFTRSYLQRYATELGLNPTPLLQEFDRAVPQRPEIAQAMRGTVTSKRSVVLPVGVAAALVSALALTSALGYGAYAWWQARDTTPPTETTATVPLARNEQVALTVTSQPRGAKVYLDNRLLGQTPIERFPLEAREAAQLRVELDGYKPIRSNVRLERDATYLAQLNPTSGTAPSLIRDAQQNALPNTAASGKPKSKNAGTTDAVPATTAPPPTGTTAEGAGSQVSGSQNTSSALAQDGTPRQDGATEQQAKQDAAQGSVTLRFNGRSWVRITSPTGEVLYEGIPPVGSQRQVPAGSTIRAGSAGAVYVQSADGIGNPLGEVGQVVEQSLR